MVKDIDSQIERRSGYSELRLEIKEIKDANERSHKEVMDILVGKEGKNGVVGKVNYHDRYIAAQVKFGWVVLTSLVGSIVVVIMSFFSVNRNS